MERFALNSNRLEEIRKQINGTQCLIIGDIMLDQYIYGAAKRISPEAPIPVVHVTERTESLGGAANVAANIYHWGTRTILGGVLADDSAGNKVIEMLSDSGIFFAGSMDSGRVTTSKTRIVGKGQQIVRFDEEVTMAIPDYTADRLLEKAAEFCMESSLIVISDYAKGVCTDYMCRRLIDEANRHGSRVVVDPKGKNWVKYQGAFVVTPNWNEFLDIAGDVCPDDEEAIKKSALEAMKRYGFSNLLITRSERGVVLVTGADCISYPAEAREVADVSGAGDTVIATLSAMLAANVELEEAVYWANKAAGLAVERRGTSVIGIEDLLREEKRVAATDSRKREFTKKIMTLQDFLSVREKLARENKKLVFTNGCFDLLHPGHLQYLSEARELGEFLVVGLNSDSSVKRQNKGKDRPVNNEQDRAGMLAAMQFVDAVVLFDADTPYELLRQIRPDILVKGGDYREADIIGREFAGETRVLSFAPGYSTTGLIDKIRREDCIS